MKLRKWVKVTLAISVSCIVVGIAGYVGVNIYVDSMLNNMNKTNEIKEEEANIAESVKEQVTNSNVVNIALFGTDHDKGEGDDSFERSDATKIISLDMDQKTIMITSLQRDNIFYIPDPINDFDKLNHAHWYGGPELAVQTINVNFDLDITKYVGFNFDSLERVVDLVGGIDVYLTRAEVSQLSSKLGFYGDAGTYHLNGDQALAYCRIRKIDSDYSRMERQNNVIITIINKAKDKNIFELLELANDILPYIETNLTNDEIKSYLMSLLSFDLKNIKQYQVPEGGFADINTRSYKGYSPLYLLRSYSDMVKQLHKNIYGNDDYQPSEQLLEIEKSIYEYFGEWKEEDSGA